MHMHPNIHRKRKNYENKINSFNGVITFFETITFIDLAVV